MVRGSARPLCERLRLWDVLCKMTARPSKHGVQSFVTLRGTSGKTRQDKLEEYLDAYIEAVGLRGDHKEPLSRSAIDKTGKLSDRPMQRGDVWRMVRRRAANAGIETAIGCHSSAQLA